MDGEIDTWIAYWMDKWLNSAEAQWLDLLEQRLRQ